jgi:hypothetical protein
MLSKEERQLEYFNKLSNNNSRYDKYLEKLSEEKKAKIAVSVKNQGVYTASPLTCNGPDKCPFFASCPINDLDANGKIQKANLQEYPVGMPCILEKSFVEQQIVDYMQHLDVDPSNPVEMSIINELALIDLYKQRCVTVLSNGDKNGFGRDFLLTEITGFNENGDVATQTKLHPLLELIDKLEKRRERWLEKLMETRKSKADFVSRLGNENQNSKVLGEIQKLREALLIAQENVIVVKDEILLDDAK